MGGITPISNEPRDYAWGASGGISRLLGWPLTTVKEAELWLGSHPAAPSRAVSASGPWRDLQQWEQSSGEHLSFLLKVLSAAEPLSIQAHPSGDKAREGFEREERLGPARDHAARNYRDPFAKPEIIVAAEDGFEALCGFQEPLETIKRLDALQGFGLGPELQDLRARLAGPDPLRTATAWSLSGDAKPRRLAENLTLVAQDYPDRFGFLPRLARFCPGDPGLLVALMTNHVVLAEGEALWLPAGNVHAYLVGTGIELMGPSDNVLRGGLTKKNIDVAELLRVVDFSPIPLPRLAHESVAENVVTYRPASEPSGMGVQFQLLKVIGDATVMVAAPSVALCVSGDFLMEIDCSESRVRRGEAVFIDAVGDLSVAGSGRLFIATGTGAEPEALDRSASRQNRAG